MRQFIYPKAEKLLEAIRKVQGNVVLKLSAFRARPKIPQVNLPKPQWPQFKKPAFMEADKTPVVFRKKKRKKTYTYLQSEIVQQTRTHADIIFFAVLLCAVSTLFITTLNYKTSRAQNAARITVPLAESSPDIIWATHDDKQYNTIEPAASEETAESPAETTIEPINGAPLVSQNQGFYQYPAEEAELKVEAVLVPQQIAVISSSQDGRIEEIPFHAGDTFSKGDTLVRYDCRDLEAEAEIVATEQALLKQKALSGYKLFKLDLISDLERLGFVTDEQKAAARQKLYSARLEDCNITADFDGRVTNRLANPGEYTRTDRVLLEVASMNLMYAEFLIPSKWLRWVNKGAPFSLKISETDKTYEAEIIRIYGEVDPVSQSVQVTAKLTQYDDPLLPGMSGTAVINIDEIRDAGITGFLEQKVTALER